MTVVGEGGTVDAQVDDEELLIWRLKFRKAPKDFWGGVIVLVIVGMLSDLAVEGGVVGQVVIVHILLLLVLLSLEDADDEPLVLELSFLSLLKAPILEMGGLDASNRGICDS